MRKLSENFEGYKFFSAFVLEKEKERKKERGVRDRVMNNERESLKLMTHLLFLLS